MVEYRAIEWSGGKLKLLDQTRLPLEQVVLDLDDYREAVRAIADMQVRGAPAIGVVAAYAVAMAARDISDSGRDEFLARLEEAGREIASARPTAVNLGWAVQRMLKLARDGSDVGRIDVGRIKEDLVAEAVRIQAEDEEINRRMGSFGYELMPHAGAC